MEQLPQNTEFVVGLLKNGLYQPEQNLVLSPYSLISALIMLLMGASGNSHLQIIKSLFNSSTTGKDIGYSKLFAQNNQVMLKQNEKALQIANFVYSSKR